MKTIPPSSSTSDLSGLRSKITELVAQNAVAMVQCAIDSVKDEGQYQSIKYLFEMIGLFPAIEGSESGGEDCLAEVLLQHLGLNDSMVQNAKRR